MKPIIGMGLYAAQSYAYPFFTDNRSNDSGNASSTGQGYMMGVYLNSTAYHTTKAETVPTGSWFQLTFTMTYSTWLTGRISSPRTGDNWGGSLVFFTNDNSSATAIQERMRITSSGNVGIGTTSPTSLLEVYKASSDNYIYTTNGTANTFNGLMVRYNGNDFMGAIGNISTGEFRIGGFINAGYFLTAYTNNTERMRITSGGNVGARVT